MKTADQYHSKLNAASGDAGEGDPEWGARFKVALALHGLRLTDVIPAKDTALYPSGWADQAPRPFPMESDEWPESTFVAWA